MLGMGPMRPLRNIPSLVVVFAFACVLSVGWLSTARAEPANSGWMTETPQLNVDPAAANSVGASECTSKPVTYTLTDLSDVTANGGSWTKTDNLCVMEGNTVDVARNSRGIMYVRPHADTTFRLLRGSVRARLTPGTNTYTYIDDAAVGKLWIVRNLTPVLQPDEASPLGELLSYRLAPDVATPLFLDADQPGGYHHVYSYAVSRDTNTLVAYVDFMGIVKLNLTNNVAMKIAQPGGADHDAVDNPKVLAVSNDGRYVFLSSFLTLIDTIDNCGEPFVLPFSQAHPLASPCPSRNFDYLVTPQVPYNFRASDASFTDGATTLAFITSSDGSASSDHDITPRKVTMSIVNTSPLQLEYLALGDSFSSGEGDLGKWGADNSLNFYKEHTDVNGDSALGIPKEKCHISQRSYPYRLAVGMSLGSPLDDGSQLWGTIACSGALINDLNGEDSQQYEGQSDGSSARLRGYDSGILKNESLNEMIPGRQKQVEFVKKYQPKVITLTIGGNDANFSDVISACVNPVLLGGGEFTPTCSYAKDDEKKANLAYAILEQRARLIALYNDLKSAGPQGMKIYVLGYPVFINDVVAPTNFVADNIKACGMNVRLNYDERRMTVEATKLLNQVIRSAAEEAGVMYINTETALEGYRLCDQNEQKAVNGITGIIDNAESFHPNAYGHVLLANRIWDATNSESLIDYTCRDSQYMVCPGGQASDIDVSDYFINAMKDHAKAISANIITENAVTIGKTVYMFTPLGLTFAANTSINILLYSNPINLGMYVVDGEGKFSQAITIPQITPGYHTLELSGTGSDGKPLTLWKIMEVRSEDPNDYDGDGIPNAQDQCNYIQPTGYDRDGDSVDDGCDPEVVASYNDFDRDKASFTGQNNTEMSSTAHTLEPKSTYETDAPQHTLKNFGGDSASSGAVAANQHSLDSVTNRNSAIWIVTSAMSIILLASGILFLKKGKHEKTN